MAGHQADRLRGEAAAARLRMGPVADLALDPWCPVEPQHRSQEPVVVRVGDRPRDALAGGGELVPPLDVRLRVIEGVRRRLVAEPPLGVRLCGALLDARGVARPDAAQPEPLTLQLGHVEPGGPRLARVVAQQCSVPCVPELAALGEPLRRVPSTVNPSRQATFRLGQLPLNARHMMVSSSFSSKPQSTSSRSARSIAPVPRMAGCDPNATSAPPVALVAQRHGPAVPPVELDREPPLGVLGPALRHRLPDELLGHLPRVGHRHRRPRLRQRVLALLEATLHVLGPVRPQRHDSVGEGGCDRTLRHAAQDGRLAGLSQFDCVSWLVSRRLSAAPLARVRCRRRYGRSSTPRAVSSHRRTAAGPTWRWR